jgi:predicted transcriptional regulator
MRKYSNIVPIRLTDEDVEEVNQMASKLNTPRSTLIRRVWREWLKLQLTEKTAG